jgi:predicted TPR repeat methyltransferase
MISVTQASFEPLLAPEAAYDAAAAYYDAWPWQAFWRRVELPTLERLVDQWSAINGRPRLADVGCGTGWYLSELRSRCRSLTGLDISVAMLAEARQRLPDAELVRGDVRCLQFENGAFDIVLSTRVLSHVEEIATAISELARIVSNGGLLMLTNVDAQHNYRETRLPVGTCHVRAETFKHSRETINSLLEQQGLIHLESVLVTRTGEVVPRENLARTSISGDAVGWITCWRREPSRLRG